MKEMKQVLLSKEDIGRALAEYIVKQQGKQGYNWSEFRVKVNTHWRGDFDITVTYIDNES